MPGWLARLGARLCRLFSSRPLARAPEHPAQPDPVRRLFHAWSAPHFDSRNREQIAAQPGMASSCMELPPVLKIELAE